MLWANFNRCKWPKWNKPSGHTELPPLNKCNIISALQPDPVMVSCRCGLKILVVKIWQTD